ncbi:hypothetical protein E4H99_20460 [Escherichia coli]|nr:hypothetical protein [Escherichia coli]TFO06016.1 hypothetical protein ELX89_20215 [Escherichia coli]
MQLASIASLELSTPLILINNRSHTDSPGIVPSHPEDALRTLQILLPYITSNKWFASKRIPTMRPVVFPTLYSFPARWQLQHLQYFFPSDPINPTGLAFHDQVHLKVFLLQPESRSHSVESLLLIS